MTAQAKRLTKRDPIRARISGYHLAHPKPEDIRSAIWTLLRNVARQRSIRPRSNPRHATAFKLRDELLCKRKVLLIHARTSTTKPNEPARSLNVLINIGNFS
jgi:hypothetical protein